MNQKWQRVVFDFDYTLADSSAGAVAGVNHALEHMGLLTAPAEQIHRSIGMSLPATLAALTEPGGHHRIAEFERLFRERAEQVMVDRSVLLPTTGPTLRTLEDQGLGLGIVSTKSRRRMVSNLAREGLGDISGSSSEEGRCRSTNLTPAGYCWLPHSWAVLLRGVVCGRPCDRCGGGVAGRHGFCRSAIWSYTKRGIQGLRHGCRHRNVERVTSGAGRLSHTTHNTGLPAPVTSFLSPNLRPVMPFACANVLPVLQVRQPETLAERQLETKTGFRESMQVVLA